MKISEALIETSKILLQAGISNHAMEARLLLGHAMNVSEEYLILHKGLEISPAQLKILQEMVDRRAKLEPMAYILGRKEFFSREFVVNSHVLIPRPDSEVLIESVLKDYKGCEGLNILDLGTGSGCLIITLLLELQNAAGIAVDIDSHALSIAQANADSLDVKNLQFIQSNWFDALQSTHHFDIIIANPPYIWGSENVAQETLLYEPHLALFAQNQGLEPYEIISKQARNFLKPEGSIYLEIGFDQAQDVTDLFLGRGYKNPVKTQDLAGHVRCLKFQI
ncbi:MAG: peptide chain release factor N(5)-glutamine methyltransferase [Pseudomonadota bacterium]